MALFLKTPRHPTTKKQHLLMLILENLKYEMQHRIVVNRSYFYDLTQTRKDA